MLHSICSFFYVLHIPHNAHNESLKRCKLCHHHLKMGKLRLKKVKQFAEICLLLSGRSQGGSPKKSKDLYTSKLIAKTGLESRFLCLILNFLFFNILFIYCFREGKGGRKRGRETSMCGCFSRTPHWGPGLQPRHVPWLGMNQRPLVHRPVLNPLSHTSQGLNFLNDYP